MIFEQNEPKLEKEIIVATRIKDFSLRLTVIEFAEHDSIKLLAIQAICLDRNKQLVSDIPTNTFASYDPQYGRILIIRRDPGRSGTIFKLQFIGGAVEIKGKTAPVNNPVELRLVTGVEVVNFLEGVFSNKYLYRARFRE